MSARVANPFGITEMRRLARPFTPSAQARARVVRSLWGSAGQEDSRAFAARELEQQQQRAADRWGFDFLREVPRAPGKPGTHRFKWTRVKIGTVPAPYRVPRMPPPAFNLEAVLQTARATVPSVPAREPQGSESAPLAAEAVTVPPAMVSPDTTTSSSSSACTTAASSRRPQQTQMTDFFRAKRPRPMEEAPSKKARTIPPAPTSLQEQQDSV